MNKITQNLTIQELVPLIQEWAKEREIYEGDILAHDYGDYSLIVYREECMAFCRIDAKNVGNINGYYNLHEEAWRSCLQRAKVIGNQYENPELLNYNND